LRRVVVLQPIPRNKFSQVDPAIVTREFAAKREEEVLERELMTMLTPVHAENSGPLLGSNQPVFAHFKPQKLLRSNALQWIWPYSGSPAKESSKKSKQSLRDQATLIIRITSKSGYGRNGSSYWD
jgi:hypothetical protein